MATFIETMLGAAEGSIVTVKPDHIVVTDGPSHKAVENVKSVATPSKVTVIFDHDVPTGSPEAAAILRKNNIFASQHGCNFVQSVGVGYQWLLNELVEPGQIVIGGGRDNSIYGSIGALGINVSIPELTRVLEGGYYSFIVPKTVVVELKGGVPVSPVDLGLTVLKKLGPAAKGKVIELTGGYGLTAQDKAVVCAMVCGTGGFSAFWTDGKTADYTVDTAEVVPMVRMPCDSRSEQNAAAILAKDAVSGAKVNAGQIGGITGGTIADLRRAVSLMEGKQLARGFRLSIVPATSRDYLMALEEGIIEKFIDFNAQIHAVGDRSVCWQGPGVIDGTPGDHWALYL